MSLPVRAALLALATTFGGALLAQADFYISNGDSVSRFTDSGTLLNSDFVSVPDAAGLAIGLDGNLYVSTTSPEDGTGAEVDSFNATTGAPVGTPFVSHITDDQMNVPSGLAFGPAGNLYVADQQGKILVYNSAGNPAQAPLTDINLDGPTSLAFNTSGTLYIADEGSGNVLSYQSGVFAIVNQAGAFAVPHDVAIGLDGNLYVLDISGSTAGIWQLDPISGLATRIVDYSTSLFIANDLMVGPDGTLYVSGQDDGENEVLKYGTDGSGGTLFADLGFGGAGPSYMAFTPLPVPEPSGLLLAAVGGLLAIGVIRWKNSAK